MKLCTETYKENANSTEALRAKQEILTRQIEAQNEKVKAQEKVLKAAENARTEARRKVELYTVSLKDAEKKLESMKMQQIRQRRHWNSSRQKLKRHPHS